MKSIRHRNGKLTSSDLSHGGCSIFQVRDSMRICAGKTEIAQKGEAVGDKDNTSTELESEVQ